MMDKIIKSLPLWRVIGRRLCEFRRDARGTMVIETAIVAPVLLLLALGSFQVSSMVARQSELQGAASDAAEIALAASPETNEELASIKAVIIDSTGLDEDDVSVSFAYRCDSATDRVSSPTSCGADEPVWSYMVISMTATYTPIWTKMGLGSPVTLKVDRAVQIS